MSADQGSTAAPTRRSKKRASPELDCLPPEWFVRPSVRASAAQSVQVYTGPLHCSGFAQIDALRRCAPVCSIHKRLGEGSSAVNGEVYSASVHGIPVAVKQQPIPEPHARNATTFLSPRNKRARTQDTWIEMMGIRCTQALLLDGVCPHFPWVYSILRCPDSTFENDRILNRTVYRYFYQDSVEEALEQATAAVDTLTVGMVQATPRLRACLPLPAHVIVMERWEGDLRHLLDTQQLKHWHLGDVLFQVAVAVHALQLHWGAVHHDLHPGNVLFRRLRLTRRGDDVPSLHWEYRISPRRTMFLQHTHDLPLIALWDFSYMEAPFMCRDSGSKVREKQVSRVSRLGYNGVDMQRIVNCVMQLLETQPWLNKVDPRALRLLEKVKTKGAAPAAFLRALYGPNGPWCKTVRPAPTSVCAGVFLLDTPLARVPDALRPFYQVTPVPEES